MKRKNKKYVVLLLTILAFATTIVFGIGYLKNHRIAQPQGSYMEKAQAEHLMNVLAAKTGMEFSTASLGEGENTGEYVTYGMYQEYINQLVQTNLINQDAADTYKAKYVNKYKKEHFLLEEDFLEAYLKLSEKYVPENAVYGQHMTMLLGGGRVIRLEDGSALSERQILTNEERIYELSLARENEEAELAGSSFLEVDCLADDDHIYYVRGKKEASLTLAGCFVAKNDEFLEGYWGDYRLLITNDTDYGRMEDIVDCVIADGRLLEVVIYQNKVHGKILSLGENFVELSMEDGRDVKYDFSKQVKAYKLFGAAETEEQPNNGLMQGRGYALSDLKVGYDFTDFVLNEENCVVAALATREEAMDNIRVLIKNNEFAGIYHDSISIQCDTDVTLRSGEMQKDYRAGEIVEITPDCGLFDTDRIFVKPVALTGRISITSLNRSQGVPAYRGTLEIVRTDEGMFCVNEVLLEEYLYSVVPSEMPSSYPAEAQKAQAISARTYAYQHMVKSTLQKFGAHVDDSTSYQVYNNIMETGAATEAVRETSGEIAMIGGEVAGTYFYSTSCGFGTDISVWHTNSKENTTHLKAKAIASEQVFTPEEVTDEEKFREYITKKHDGDFESEEGWYRWTYTTELDGERLLANLQNRHDAYPKEILTEQSDGSFLSEPIDAVGDITQIRVNKRLAGGVIDELDFVGTKKTVRVISERNVRYVLANESGSVKRQSGDESKVSTMIPSAFAVINQTVDENGIVTGYEVIGGGYGHGIGLSQNGAKDMAQAGYTCGEIMQFFYEGVVLKKINSD